MSATQAVQGGFAGPGCVHCRTCESWFSRLALESSTWDDAHVQLHILPRVPVEVLQTSTTRAWSHEVAQSMSAQAAQCTGRADACLYSKGRPPTHLAPQQIATPHPVDCRCPPSTDAHSTDARGRAAGVFKTLSHTRQITAKGGGPHHFQVDVVVALQPLGLGVVYDAGVPIRL